MEARDMEQEVPEATKTEASEYQVVEETDYVDSEFDEGRQSVMEFLLLMSDVDKIEESALTNTESCVLRRSWELLLGALGERESLGDALYGALTGSLVVLKERESFKNPRAVTSLKLFNGFRVLTEKSHNPEELKTHIETLAFKHLGNDITQPRVDAVNDAFLELLEQNVSDLPPGSVSAWQKILIYTGSCFRFVSSTYTERLKVIQEDWEVIQDAEEADTEECVVRSFGGMCYAVPIELFAPFTDCCVAVMKPLIAEIPKEYAIKIIWCPADGSHEIADAYLTILENCYVLKLALPAAPTSINLTKLTKSSK
ncbi:Retrovirus-related Pol polyprotein from transposon TNT 1-94 [Durusdinium trenchii]|uniref:Retrovirus-related Pol polyprotein from transposon TNT 1-94 n=1 Tax=Durusdinium trenchii TaxID=1381693 RepID=A0ABP0SH01_9DINO